MRGAQRAAAYLACSDRVESGQIVWKEVPVQVEVQHIVDRVEIREVPTERVVMQEVPVMVDKVIVRDVPYPVERFVEKEVIKEITKVVENEKPVFGIMSLAVHALPLRRGSTRV